VHGARLRSQTHATQIITVLARFCRDTFDIDIVSQGLYYKGREREFEEGMSDEEDEDSGEVWEVEREPLQML
jgi:hypothetical protein